MTTSRQDRCRMKSPRLVLVEPWWVGLLYASLKPYVFWLGFTGQEFKVIRLCKWFGSFILDHSRLVPVREQ